MVWRCLVAEPCAGLNDTLGAAHIMGKGVTKQQGRSMAQCSIIGPLLNYLLIKTTLRNTLDLVTSMHILKNTSLVLLPSEPAIGIVFQLRDLPSSIRFLLLHKPAILGCTH